MTYIYFTAFFGAVAFGCGWMARRELEISRRTDRPDLGKSIATSNAVNATKILVPFRRHY